MKRAICTLCIGDEAKAFARYSHPIFRAYANAINADFVVIREPKVNYKNVKHINWLKFEKYQLYDLLEKFDRIAYFDSDILITPNARDIFKTTAYQRIGGVFEDFGSDEIPRRRLIKQVQDVLGDVGWKTGFMNSGVMVVSKPHRIAFKLIWDYGVFDDPLTKYEQTNTNWYFHKAGFNIKNISYKWNFMGIMRVYYGPYHRQAYAIHYAGGGIFHGRDRIEQIKEDFEFFYGKLGEEKPYFKNLKNKNRL